jgi:LPXTG-motif cell wall-anchored protein
VTPTPGTHALSLFLYADGPGNGSSTVDAYTNISVRSDPGVTPMVVVATSPHLHSTVPVLTTADSTFSSVWTVTHPSQHVLVDGMTNGWLADASERLIPHETTEAILHDGFVAAWVGAGTTALLALSALVGRRRKRHLPPGEIQTNTGTT